MIYSKGDKIGSYTVTFPHKQGAYAETYRVKDRDGKTCFLKLIDYSKLKHSRIDDSGNILEIEITKQCSHRNLCKYIDSGRILAGGRQWAYLVTGFVSGETLSQKVIREGDPDVYAIKQIAIHVLEALKYLHSLPRPIVHGEVAMQNVLVNFIGGWEELKLIDFGHARYLDQPPSKPDLDTLNAFCLAPECFSGVFQVQSDLYSVGVLMYQLLYDKLPWFTDLSKFNRGERIDALLEEREKELDIPDIEKFELDEQLVNCIVKALSYDVEDRFQTAKEFVRAINGEIKVVRQDTRRKVRSDGSKQRGAKGIPNLSRKAAGPGFAAIAGMEDLKRQMREEVIEPLRHPEVYEKYGITIPNGMLLYGPPGCGKTFFSKHFAEEAGFNFMQVTPATLKSRWINATQENIAKMFKEAEANAPTIIFIDEIDDLLKDRSLADDKGMSGINEFLAQMDRTGEKGIFIIGATNRPDILDAAVLRAGRLEKKYYIGLPDKAAREALFRLYLKERPWDFGIDYAKLAGMTRNYLSADIKRIVNDAALDAVKANSNITMDILCAAIGRVKQSLSDQKLQEYERIKALMDGEAPNKNARPKIGFTR